MEIYCKKLDGKLYFAPPQYNLRQRFIESIKDGSQIRETLSKVGSPKTNNQLGAIFGLALYQIEQEFEDRGWDSSIIMRIDNPTGTKVTKDALKQFFYAQFPVFGDDGKQITLSGMTTVQAAQYFDNVRNFAASQWSIVIPEPNPNYKESGQ